MSDSNRYQKKKSAYPGSGRFRLYEGGKDYYQLWQEYQSGKRLDPPPDFWTPASQWRRRGFSLRGRDRKFKKP